MSEKSRKRVSDPVGRAGVGSVAFLAGLALSSDKRDRESVIGNWPLSVLIKSLGSR
ncbi:7316_t:CDS:2, partial [Gigaspora margarita]